MQRTLRFSVYSPDEQVNDVRPAGYMAQIQERLM